MWFVFVRASSVNLHIWLGLAIALILLFLSFLALFTRGMRQLGVIGIIYTGILPALGLMQYTLLAGDLHWLIQLLHLLIGVGAIGMVHLIGGRYQQLKLAVARTTSENAVSQATSS
jgi:hypothetical protein